MSNISLFNCKVSTFYMKWYNKNNKWTVQVRGLYCNPRKDTLTPKCKKCIDKMAMGK